jgi:hypothetical protein
LGQPGQHPFRGKVENRLEVRSEDVGFGFGVVVDVARGQLFVERQIPAGCSGLDAKACDQVLAADLPNEAYAQLHECEAVALRLGEFCKLFDRHLEVARSS